MELSIKLSIEEYERFMEQYFPEMFKCYNFIVDKMTNNYLYEEIEVKKILLANIVPLINEKIEEIRKKEV